MYVVEENQNNTFNLFFSFSLPFSFKYFIQLILMLWMHFSQNGADASLI